MTAEEIYSVSEINSHMKLLVDSDISLRNIRVCGELSNFKVYPTACYFSLKDSSGSLKCVLFRNSYNKNIAALKNGAQVLAQGRISVYPRDGVYQLYCNDISPAGLGDIYLAFEQLKAKLSKEGLFSDAHKKRLPLYPRKIGIVTSASGAAVHDMIRILGKRWPAAEVLLLPVKVQGDGAAEEIADAVSYANQYCLVDLLIVGRGGGSAEDLWEFNEECVARAVYNSQIPVISAVGHEPDVTIIDFVADVRASTPSNAAELAVQDRYDVACKLQQIEVNFYSAMEHLITYNRSLVHALSSRPVMKDASYAISTRRNLLSSLYASLILTMKIYLQNREQELAALAASLDSMSPLGVLSRGYSLAESHDKTIKSSAADFSMGEEFLLLCKDGSINCKVNNINYNSSDEVSYGKKETSV